MFFYQIVTMRDDERTEFEVEEILDCSTDSKTGSLQFYVKWVGYSWRFCTWEPATNLENAQLAILEYEWRFPERFPRSQQYLPLQKPKPDDQHPLAELKLRSQLSSSVAPVSGYRSVSLSPTKTTTVAANANGASIGAPNGAIERTSAKPALKGGDVMRKFLRIVGKNYKWNGKLLDLPLLFCLVLRATADPRRFQLFPDEMEKPARGAKRKHEPASAAANNGTESIGGTTNEKEAENDAGGGDPPAKREAALYGLRAATHRPVALYVPPLPKAVPGAERPIAVPCRPLPTPKLPALHMSKISLRKQKENAKHTLQEFERFINESNKRINSSAAKTTLENIVDLEVLPAGDFQ